MRNVSRVFIGRQPILDIKKQTYAYELLYRAGLQNIFPGIPDTQATIRLLENSFCNFGLDRITGGRRAFINFSRSFLLSDLTFLAPKMVVIEILEDVAVDEELVETVSILKKKGYRIALDDFVFTHQLEPLIPLADFIKVDWLDTSGDEREAVSRDFASSDTRLIAEKIETADQFNQARDLGYDYFQGFFFARPKVLKAREVKPSRRTRLRIMAAVNHPDVDMEQIHALLVKDPALSVKILRLVNSAAIGISERISSIRQAVTLLGERKLKQWLTIIFLSSISRGVPDVLFDTAVIRAGFSEKMAQETGHPEFGPAAFMSGLLSMVEAIFNTTAENVLKGLPLGQEIIDAVIFRKGPIYPLIALAQACERADLGFINRFSSITGVSQESIGNHWLEAIRWATDSTQGLSEI